VCSSAVETAQALTVKHRDFEEPAKACNIMTTHHCGNVHQCDAGGSRVLCQCAASSSPASAGAADGEGAAATAVLLVQKSVPREGSVEVSRAAAAAAGAVVPL
jgi:hypothetical protein